MPTCLLKRLDFQHGCFIHLHGRQDEHVPVSQARRIHAALKAGNARTELVELEGDHFINETHQDEVERRLLAFFGRELAHAPSVSAGWSSGR